MAEIKIGGVTYTAIDDKNASALIVGGVGAITIQDKVKIEGNEYIVTRIVRAEGQSYLYRISGSRKDYTGYRNFLCDIPDTVTSIDDLTSCSTTIPTSVLIISRIYTSIDPVTIKIKSMNPPMLGSMTSLTSVSANTTLIVPKGALEVYKNHPQWGRFNHISEDPNLNEDSVPSSSNKVSSNSKEMSELKKELNELRKDFNEFRKDIANLMKLHKELREDFEELKKKD